MPLKPRTNVIDLLFNRDTSISRIEYRHEIEAQILKAFKPMMALFDTAIAEGFKIEFDFGYDAENRPTLRNLRVIDDRRKL